MVWSNMKHPEASSSEGEAPQGQATAQARVHTGTPRKPALPAEQGSPEAFLSRLSLPSLQYPGRLSHPSLWWSQAGLARHTLGPCNSPGQEACRYIWKMLLRVSPGSIPFWTYIKAKESHPLPPCAGTRKGREIGNSKNHPAGPLEPLSPFWPQRSTEPCQGRGGHRESEASAAGGKEGVPCGR